MDHELGIDAVSIASLATGGFLITKIKETGEKVGKNIVRTSWNGYKNIFKATAEEISEAASKIENHRIIQKAGKQGNYGYLEGNINGKNIDNQIWLSINFDRAKDEIHIFEAISVEGNRGAEWLRITDSEYRMLNNLADELGAKKGGKYPNIKGELKIISENPYCESCTGVIQQFNEMYPNIKLILIDGAK